MSTHRSSLWVLEKDFTFEASHQLPVHDGKCARLHGHSWKMTVRISGGGLHAYGPKLDMVMDYGDVKAAVNPLVEAYLDHWHLNNILENPTSEKLAEWVYDRLEGVLPGLHSVTIEETCTARCTFTRRTS